MRPDGPRPPVAGPATPEPPYPIAVSGPIVKGFGRGSAELGIPTANIPLTGLSVGGHDELASGVYYGWAGVAVDSAGRRRRGTDQQTATGNSAGEEVEKQQQQQQQEGEEGVRRVLGEDGLSVKDGTIFPMVMSLGYNPYYKNTVRSIEVHIMHAFAQDFYGARMNLLICGFIRPEYDYVSKESLVEDIKVDIQVARTSLARVGYVGLLDRGELLRKITDFAPVAEEEAGRLNGEANGGL